MTYEINETHDPALKSWVESANDPNTDFPIQNLPFCVLGRADTLEDTRIGVAIGDQILDVYPCYEAKLFEDNEEFVIACLMNDESLELAVMHKWLESRSYFRKKLIKILSQNADERTRKIVQRNLIPISEVELSIPVQIGDYTDFYASIFHATNIGSMFRPDNPLLPNYKYVPIGYHGRASSIVVSGTEIKRPQGQTKPDPNAPPVFGLSKSLDYEMEVGFFVGRGNKLGEPVPIEKAEEHIFGLCLVNDWSARDIQPWEYQPLGPFLAKNFATTISPFVVTMEALAPFRTKAFKRAEGDPAPLPYLYSEKNEQHGGIDITLEVHLQTAKMREENVEPVRLSKGNFKDMYWTIAQLLTHHTSNGCNLQTGDLLASGTISGETKDSVGSMMELTWRGTQPITLPNGETRKFLEDGDEVIMRGYCEREGFRRIGFGECRGIASSSRQSAVSSKQLAVKSK
jgi:fumarylacetoacetase